MFKRINNNIYKDYSEYVLKKDGSHFLFNDDNIKRITVFLGDKMDTFDNEELEIEVKKVLTSLQRQEQVALELVSELFAEKKDLSGAPYIEHLKFVSKNTQLAKGKIIGLLHDIIEDTFIEEDDLRELGFDEEIIEAVSILTRKKAEPYETYIQKVSRNIYASDVKIADITHNKDLSRLPKITEKDLERLKKYESSLNFLKDVWEGVL